MWNPLQCSFQESVEHTLGKLPNNALNACYEKNQNDTNYDIMRNIENLL